MREKRTPLARSTTNIVTDDHYSQAGNLFRLMPKEEQELLCKNIAGSLKHASKEIQELQLLHFQKADVNYAS
jgi:catalase